MFLSFYHKRKGYATRIKRHPEKKIRTVFPAAATHGLFKADRNHNINSLPAREGCLLFGIYHLHPVCLKGFKHFIRRLFIGNEIIEVAEFCKKIYTNPLGFC